jgi:hypothetical protein
MWHPYVSISLKKTRGRERGEREKREKEKTETNGQTKQIEIAKQNDRTEDRNP